MEPLGASGADKKRNKLGYHRTSVACVHCRRRKIRCLVAADDSQGRCENCIRLRKECQFYPVDQQPPTDRKSSRPGGIKMETPSSSADPSIASSSPPPAGLGGGMDPSEIYQYQQLSLHSAATTPEISATGFHPSAGFSVASMGGFANGTTSPVDGVAHPELLPGQTIDPNATYNMGNPSPVMWTQGQMLTAATPHPQQIPTGIPHHPQMLSPAAAAAATSYTVQPDGSIWPAPPPRSMTTIPSQPDMYHPHPHQHAIFATSPAVPPPELKRSMTSPAAAAAGGPQLSPLHSPVSAQIPINYSGQPIQYQHHAPPPPTAQGQPYPPQWNSGMSAIPMADGTYTTIYAPPEHYQMAGPQHPATGP
ncbi:hypothetical protein TMatcc_001575 [Talaromyces marneffei ATCC 18224]|nr:uncharacterized protein EYB26_007207 [Talaromyces marneffei]QGA19518.1 hypothetical protein EYB26_007207 [Talaromyces marneffei]